MLRIRLQRTGRTSTPTFRIVLAEHSAPVKGNHMEILGTYLPSRDPVVFTCNADRVAHWMKSGAQPSNTVARLLRKAGIKGMDPFVKPYTKKRRKGETENAAGAPPAEKGDDKESK